MSEDISENLDNGSMPYKHRVHHILAHSYLFYFGAFMVGLFLDFLFPLKLFNFNDTAIWGFLALLLGTSLVVWAQKASKIFKTKKQAGISKETFLGGPYKYTRSPTHYGLLLLIAGFGVLMNAFFIIASSVVAFLVSKFYFLPEEEHVLCEKYGSPYVEYKKEVKI